MVDLRMQSLISFIGQLFTAEVFLQKNLILLGDMLQKLVVVLVRKLLHIVRDVVHVDVLAH